MLNNYRNALHKIDNRTEYKLKQTNAHRGFVSKHIYACGKCELDQKNWTEFIK